MKQHETIKKIAKAIGKFFLRKNSNDYERTEKELDDINITKIIEIAGNIEITAERVGILIGKRGTVIDELSQYLKDTMGINHVKIVEEEDPLYQYLIPKRWDRD